MSVLGLEPPPASLGERLRALRIERGLTSTALARPMYSLSYVSQDGGVTWSPFNGPGLRDHRVETVAVDPDGSTLFAGTIFGGLFRTSL